MGCLDHGFAETAGCLERGAFYRWFAFGRKITLPIIVLHPRLRNIGNQLANRMINGINLIQPPPKRFQISFKFRILTPCLRTAAWQRLHLVFFNDLFLFLVLLLQPSLFIFQLGLIGLLLLLLLLYLLCSYIPKLMNVYVLCAL